MPISICVICDPSIPMGASPCPGRAPLKPDGDWDDYYEFYDTENVALGVSSTTGGVGPVGGKTKLHTIILHCNAAGNGAIAVDHEPDGAVYDIEGSDYQADPADGMIYQLGCVRDADCDDGLFCNGTETCEIGTGTC